MQSTHTTIVINVLDTPDLHQEQLLKLSTKQSLIKKERFKKNDKI